MESDQEQREVASQSQLAFSKLKAFFLCLAVLCIWRLIQYVAKKNLCGSAKKMPHITWFGSEALRRR